MRWFCFNKIDLILRRPRSGRLEGWASGAIYGDGIAAPGATSSKTPVVYHSGRKKPQPHHGRHVDAFRTI
jgi:hypothetical protein